MPCWKATMVRWIWALVGTRSGSKRSSPFWLVWQSTGREKVINTTRMTDAPQNSLTLCLFFVIRTHRHHQARPAASGPSYNFGPSSGSHLNAPSRARESGRPKEYFAFGIQQQHRQCRNRTCNLYRSPQQRYSKNKRGRKGEARAGMCDGSEGGSRSCQGS